MVHSGTPRPSRTRRGVQSQSGAFCTNHFPIYATHKFNPQPDVKVPPEVVDIIIDHLYEDKSALSACALVCRSWVPCARYHLFRSLNVDRSPMQRTSKVPPDLRAFLQLLLSNPTLCDNVQRLSLAGRFSREHCFQVYLISNTYSGHDAYDLDFGLLSQILLKLPKVRILELNGLRFHYGRLSPTLSPRFLTFKLDVLALDDSASIFPSGRNLMEVLNIFSELGMLILKNVGWNRVTMNELSRILVPKTLKITWLAVVGCSVDTLALVRRSWGLHSLVGVLTSMSQLRRLGKFLLEFGPNIINFHLDIEALLKKDSSNMALHDTRTFETLNISHLVALDSFVFSAVLDGDEDEQNRSVCSVLHSILSSIRSPIRNVLFDLKLVVDEVFRGGEWFRHFDLEDIDRILNKPSLECAFFRLRYDPDARRYESESIQTIQRGLHTLHKKGRLQFVSMLGDKPMFPDYYYNCNFS